MGAAVPHVTRRHSHPRVAKDPEPPPVPTGIDYLALIEARHSEEMAKRIVYTDLPDGAGPSEEDMDGIVITRPASWTSSPTGPSRHERDSHEHRAASRPLRLFEDALRKGRRPRSAASPRRPPGGRRPGRVPRRGSPRRGANRRSRLRQDRGSSGRGRRTRFVAPYRRLPRQPDDRRARECTQRSSSALGGVPRFHAAALVPQTADLLAQESAERGKKVILAVDEAHLLSPSSSRAAPAHERRASTR